MVKQWAIAAGNAPNGNFNGPQTHAQIWDNEKLNLKQQSTYIKHIYMYFFQINILI